MDYPLQSQRVGESPFDVIMHVEKDGDEWWSARELMSYLGYAQWRNLENVISKAKSACRNSGHQPSDHFADVSNLVGFGKGGKASCDVRMTRFGCYLVAMNGDPDKDEVAAAQRYFAIMSRIAEKHAPIPMTAVDRPWSIRFRDTTFPHLRYVNEHYPDCFTVATTLVVPMLFLEEELIRHMFQPQSSDRPDVSIGLCLANYRRKQGLPPAHRFAPLRLPDQDRDVELCVYDNFERGQCESWFARTYLREKLPDYLNRKPEFRVHGELPPASVADHTCIGLTGHQAKLRPKIRRQLELAGGFFPAGAKMPALEYEQRSLFDL